MSSGQSTLTASSTKWWRCSSPSLRLAASGDAAVFLNLFLNARDAMSKGGWLTIQTRLEGQNALVDVADTGSGIPPELLSRIYDPFFTTKAPGKGTGLGLSVIYGVVQEHHGVIECESVPGQGTQFTLKLPLSAARERTASAAQ